MYTQVECSLLWVSDSHVSLVGKLSNDIMGKAQLKFVLNLGRVIPAVCLSKLKKNCPSTCIPNKKAHPEAKTDSPTLHEITTQDPCFWDYRD